MKSKIEKVCKCISKNRKIMVGGVMVFFLGALLGWIINDNNHMRHMKNGVMELNKINEVKNLDPAVKINFE